MAILKFIVSMIGVFWLAIAGGYGVYWYDRLPAGWPHYTAHLGPFSHTFSLPDSIGAQLAALKDREAKAATHAHGVETAQAKISTDAGVHDQTAQAQIRVVHDIQTKEIPFYVTAQTDHAFPLSWGFVRVHDGAARGIDVSRISIPAGQSDDAAASISPSDALGAVVDNYASCRDDDQQLIDLQNLVRAENTASH